MVPAPEKLCEVDDDERALLRSPARPIVLLTRRLDAPVAHRWRPDHAGSA